MEQEKLIHQNPQQDTPDSPDIWMPSRLSGFDHVPGKQGQLHAKSAGAYGTFTVTHDISMLSRADLFRQVGQTTPIFARFSSISGGRSAAESRRVIRGFALKFFTRQGEWDLMGSSSPVFFVRDERSLSDLSRALIQPTSHGAERIDWQFFASHPESLHQVSILMSDRGIPDGYRHMHGYSAHCYSFTNAQNQHVWVKFHLRTCQGVRCLSDRQAQSIGVRDREHGRRDLFDAIAYSRYPRWKLYVQVMTPEQALRHRDDPFDVTKTWSHRAFPLMELGELVLNRNPVSQFRDVEQLPFSPTNMPPGIGASPDKLLQARLRRHANMPRLMFGMARPQQENMFCPFTQEDQDQPLRPGDYGLYDDCFYQTGALWRLLPEQKRRQLIENTQHSIRMAPRTSQYLHAAHCTLADALYGEQMTEALSLKPQRVAQLARMPHTERMQLE